VHRVGVDLEIELSRDPQRHPSHRAVTECGAGGGQRERSRRGFVVEAQAGERAHDTVQRVGVDAAFLRQCVCGAGAAGETIGKAKARGDVDRRGDDMSGHQLKNVLNGFGCGLHNGRDRCGHGALLEDGRMSVVEAMSIPAVE